MTHRQAVALGLAIVAIWGATFPLLREVSPIIPAVALVGIRFALAAGVLVPGMMLLRRERQRFPLRQGASLGVLLFGAFLAQVLGMQTVTANRAAFLIGLGTVLVPVFGLLVGRPTPRAAVFAMVLGIAGVYLVSSGPGVGGGGVGDWWLVSSAVLFAGYIVMLEGVAAQHDPFALGTVQVCTVAACAVAWYLPTVVRHGLPLALLREHWGALLYLGVVVSGATTVGQALVQRHLRAFEAALLYALEPVFAAVFAFFLLGETLTPRGMLGGVIVVGAAIWSQLLGPARPAGEVEV